MTMDTEPIYFPILRAKTGEKDALGWFSPGGRLLTRPMLDFPELTPKNRALLEQFLAENIRDIATSWGTAGGICLDFSRYGPDECVSDGRHVIEYVFDLARQARLKCLPVTGPLSLRGPGTAYFEAVSRIAARDGRGMAFRIPTEDFVTPVLLKGVLDETLALVSVAPGNVDVYLDAGSLFGLHPESADEFSLMRSLQAAAELTHALGYRRTIFVASSMPDGMVVRHKKGQVLRVPRAEFRLWRRIVADPDTPYLNFGDYGVIYPTQSEAEIRRAPPSRVRVTTENEHVLYKDGPKEIRAICRRAVEDGVLNGAATSWGAQAIRDCATGRGGEGNASTWVARDTNVHMENTVAIVAREAAVKVKMPSGVVTAETAWLQNSLVFPHIGDA